MWRISEIKPTVLIRNESGNLLQKVVVRFEDHDPDDESDDSFTLQATTEFSSWSNSIRIEDKSCEAWVPDIVDACEMCFILSSQDMEIDRRIVTWLPQKRWEVCWVPVTHTDYGYTNAIDELLDLYDSYFENILNYCADTAHLPFESQYRYTVETLWPLIHFLANCPDEKKETLIRYIREGRIEISAFLCNIVDSVCSCEELHRALYHAARLKTEYKIPLRSASLVDIPGMSWGTIQVLAAADIKYLFVGFPTYFQWGEKSYPEFWDENQVLRHGKPDAFYWQGPDGSRILAYYQGSYGWMAGPTTTNITGPHSLEEVEANLPFALMQMDDAGTPFSVCRFIDHCLDNLPPSNIISSIVQDWNLKYEYPKLMVATNSQFFDKLEQQCVDARTIRGELPHTDYNVAMLSAAKESAINRNTHELLMAAQTLCVLDNLCTSADYPSEEMEKAYDNVMMFDEHCYGMARNHGIWQDYNWSLRVAHVYRAAFLARKMLRRSMEHIATSVRADLSEQSIVVFNPLPYKRSGLVRLIDFVPKHGSDFRIKDCSTGDVMACQLSKLMAPDQALPYAPERFSLGYHYKEDINELVFVATDVPGAGYKTYMFDYSDIDPVLPPVSPSTECSIENEFYLISADPINGLVTRVYDKVLDKELLDQSGEGFCMPLLHHIVSDKLEQPAFQAMETEAGHLESVLRIRLSLSGCPHITQELHLYQGIRRIDVSNRILKDITPHQALYFTFPFAISQPKFSYDGTTSAVLPFIDQLPGSNTHYYSMQRWARVSGEDLSVVLTSQDTSIVQFGERWPCRVSQAHHCRMPKGFDDGWHDPSAISQGHIYSLALISNFRTNFAATQCGDMLFRFSVTSSKLDHDYPYTYGTETAIPLLALSPNRRTAGSLARSNGLIEFSCTNGILETIKQADDKNGLIFRVRETQGRAGMASLHLPHIRIEKAYLTNGIEENQAAIPFKDYDITLKLRPWQIMAIRVIPNKDYPMQPVYDWSSLY